MMLYKPISYKENILDKIYILKVVRQVFLMSSVTLIAFFIGKFLQISNLVPNLKIGQTMAFLVLGISSILNIFNIFGDNYFKDFEDSPRMVGNDFLFNVNDLQYRRDVLKWYIDMNSGGTVHSTAEIPRVQSLLDEEINKDKEDLCYE